MTSVSNCGLMPSASTIWRIRSARKSMNMSVSLSAGGEEDACDMPTAPPIAPPTFDKPLLVEDDGFHELVRLSVSSLQVIALLHFLSVHVCIHNIVLRGCTPPPPSSPCTPPPPPPSSPFSPLLGCLLVCSRPLP